MAYHRALPHANDRVGLIVMTSAFFLTAILAVLLRFYSRQLSKLHLGPDDWFAFASLFFVLALNGIFLSGLIQGAITGHSVVINNWPQPSPLEELAQKYKYAFQTTEKIAFGLIKISILFLWKRILSPIRSFQLFCWTMIGIVAAWSISFFFATVFQCGTHWDWNWAPIGFFLTECTDTLNMLTVFCGTDLLTDFVIIFMPVPIIWKLKMSVRKKIGVTSVFMVGIFTIGAGVARTYIYLVTSYDKEDNLDFIADFTLFILWSEIEVNVAMIVCCMPVFGPVLGQCRDTLYHQIGRCKDEESDLLGHSKTSSNDEKASNSLGASSVTYVQPGCSCEANPDPPAANKAEEGKDSSQSHLGALDIGNQPAARSGGIHVRTEITSGTSARGL